MKSNSLTGKIVVVTGASAGVGRATALRFAKHSATVALIARGREGLEGAKKEIEAIGGKAHIFFADVSQVDEVEKTTARIENELTMRWQVFFLHLKPSRQKNLSE
jgi:NADP-dependent 3-hydroxy acid dehydrogenase YdfG